MREGREGYNPDVSRKEEVVPRVQKDNTKNDNRDGWRGEVDEKYGEGTIEKIGAAMENSIRKTLSSGDVYRSGLILADLVAVDPERAAELKGSLSSDERAAIRNELVGNIFIPGNERVGRTLADLVAVDPERAAELEDSLSSDEYETMIKAMMRQLGDSRNAADMHGVNPARIGQTLAKLRIVGPKQAALYEEKYIDYKERKSIEDAMEDMIRDSLAGDLGSGIIGGATLADLRLFRADRVVWDEQGLDIIDRDDAVQEREQDKEEFNKWMDKVLPGGITALSKEAVQALEGGSMSADELAEYYSLSSNEHMNARDYFERRKVGNLTDEEMAIEKHFAKKFPKEFSGLVTLFELPLD